MTYDKRLIRVLIDTPQPRVVKPRVGVVARGHDFIDGDGDGGLWVSPVTGVLQSTPNSEEPQYATENTGRWKKLGLSDVDVLDDNPAGGAFKMMAASGMHEGSAFYYSGTNTAGVGAITKAASTQNTGANHTIYAYDKATNTGGVLIEGGWGATADYLSGVSWRVGYEGRIEVWRNGDFQGRGSFGGSGYAFGTAQGGSYARPSDQFLSLRVEASRGRYLLFTSSMGGVYLFDCPWAVDRYNPDGSLQSAAQPVLPAAKMWFRVPEGGCCVVWSKVVYAPTGVRHSVPFALSEIPGAGRTFSGRTIPVTGGTTVTLAAPTGSGAFDVNTNRCRAKVQASTAPVWIDGTSTRYEPVTASVPGGGEDGDGIDVTEWLREFSYQMADGPEGASAHLALSLAVRRQEDGAWFSKPCPVDLLTEVENRAFRVELVTHPDDPESPPTTVLLDGVLSPPEYVDALTVAGRFVRFDGNDRLALLKDAKVSETVVFDDSWLCRPPSGAGGGDSVVAVCLRQGGIEVPTDLPLIDFTFEHVPPQRAGDWTFEARAGQSWWDVLVSAFDHAPSLVWGVKPTAAGPRFFVVDPATSTAPVATLYRTPEEADAAGEPSDSELGAFPALYGGHSRRKLPLEGNLVHVLGLDPASRKPILEVRSDDDSRDPAGTRDGKWLGSTRTIGFQSGSITSRTMASRIADSLAAAVRQRQYVEPWRSFMLFKDDHSPVWRGDMVTLAGGLPDGGDSDVRVSSCSPEVLDENGGGLMTAAGRQAPVSVRLANYTGGALVGLGGAGPSAIAQRQKRRVAEGGWRGQGARRIPSVSPGTIATVSF